MDQPECTLRRKTWKKFPSSSILSHFIPQCDQYFLGMFVHTFCCMSLKIDANYLLEMLLLLHITNFKVQKEVSCSYHQNQLLRGGANITNLGQLRSLFCTHPLFPGPPATGGLALLCLFFVIHFLCLNYISLFHSAQMFDRCLTSGIPHPVNTYSSSYVVFQVSGANSILHKTTHYSCMYES